MHQTGQFFLLLLERYIAGTFNPPLTCIHTLHNFAGNSSIGIWPRTKILRCEKSTSITLRRLQSAPENDDLLEQIFAESSGWLQLHHLNILPESVVTASSVRSGFQDQMCLG
jgi:hypothetical protein